MADRVTCLGVELRECGGAYASPVRGRVHVRIERDVEVRGRWRGYAWILDPLDRFHERFAPTPQQVADLVGAEIVASIDRLQRDLERAGVRG